jgi:hypothetical protein
LNNALSPLYHQNKCSNERFRFFISKTSGAYCTWVCNLLTVLVVVGFETLQSNSGSGVALLMLKRARAHSRHSTKETARARCDAARTRTVHAATTRTHAPGEEGSPLHTPTPPPSLPQPFDSCRYFIALARIHASLPKNHPPLFIFFLSGLSSSFQSFLSVSFHFAPCFLQ